MKHIFTTLALSVSFVLLILGDTYAQLPSDPFVAYDGNPLDKLASVMPKVDPEMVQRRLYGKV